MLIKDKHGKDKYIFLEGTPIQKRTFKISLDYFNAMCAEIKRLSDKCSELERNIKELKA